MTDEQEIPVMGTDGRALTLLVRRSGVSTSTLYARTRVVGAPSLALKETGEKVTRIEKGVYEVVSSGERLTSTDPGAP